MLCCWHTELIRYRKAQSLQAIIDHQALPVNILFDNPVFTASLRLASVRAVSASHALDSEAPFTSLQGSLKLVRQYTEHFYVINHVVNGQLQQP